MFSLLSFIILTVEIISPDVFRILNVKSFWLFQARLLQESRYISIDNSPLEQGSENETWISQQHPTVQEVNKSLQGELKETQELKPICEDDYLREIVGVKAKYPMYDTDKDASLQDGDVSCLATCSTVDIEDDPFKGSYTYEAAGTGGEDESGSLTSCVGTRWFRAPELLYGSTCYGLEVDLWSLGCIFAELLSLEPIFPGTSDLDQLAKIIAVLGDMNEETWPGCSKLPDYSKISFNKIENPAGLEACLPNRSPAEVNIVRKLLCYDPARRATAMELLDDCYFGEEPLPVSSKELRVPSTRDGHDESSGEEWGNNRDMESDSELEEFGRMDMVTTEKGFSLRFS